MSSTVRTRFAPSPTGYLHIGGARTALFNYLVARRLGGVFVLRIEDTDQTRNIAGAERKLLDDLRWLGLNWDEGPQAGGEFGPYCQSERLERYRDATQKLLDAGDAYYAFDTREELDALRKEAVQAKHNFRYPRPESFPTEADAQRVRDAGDPVVVRFKTPRRDFTIRDKILGEVVVAAGELDDFVLVKADGWPTYNFAVVVDDADMRITHVLRGQEHLVNTAKQIALQQALGYEHPAFAHLPIILNMDGSKMSKREKDKAVRKAVTDALARGTLNERRVMELSGCEDQAALRAWRGKKTQLNAEALARLAAELGLALPEIDIHDFRASGYLPEALLNFIALLGWSAGDDREHYSLDELCAAFALDRIGKTNARFDRAKLLSFNTDALAAAPLERKLHAFRDYLSVNPASAFVGVEDDILSKLIEVCAGFRTFRDIEHKAGALFLSDERIERDPAAVKKVLQKNCGAGLKTLAQVRDALDACDDWSAESLEALLGAFTDSHGLGLGKVAQPIRVALTGSTISPAIFETLALLGRERTLARIDQTLAEVTSGD